MQSTHPIRVRILHAGHWGADSVDHCWASNTRRRLPEVETAIDIAWAAATARPGIHLFDGPMCRLESWHADADRLRLTLSQSSYKQFLGTNMAHPEFARTFGRDVMANPVGLSAALLTADRRLLLGHRSQSVAYYPGRIHPFAGSLEPKDASLFAAVGRELSEELSLAADHLRSIRCIGIAEDPSLCQPELIFAVESSRTLAETEARLDPVEHNTMVAISAGAQGIEKALADEARLTPIAIASLLLWGRVHLSQAWFEGMLPMLSDGC